MSGTPAFIKRIREEYAAGANVQTLADTYDRSVSTIRRYCKGVRRDVPSAPPPGGAVQTHRATDTETAEMWRLWVSGMTQQQIGEQYHLTQGSVSSRLKLWAERLPQSTREELVARELALLDELRARTLEIFYNRQLDPETRLRAADRVFKGMERLAKMAGLDQPEGLSLTGPVTFEILGVPDEALT